MKKPTLLLTFLLTILLGACSTSGPTPTPGSGDKPVIVRFEASPALITAGGSSELAWQVTGADTVSIDKGVGTVQAQSSSTVKPSSTTTYTLTASNAAGSVTKTVTVTVNQPSPGEGEVSQLGIVVLDQTAATSETSVSGFGVFLEFPVALEGFDPANPYAGVLDTCTVTSGDDLSPSPLIPDTDFAFVSAGTALTLNAGTPYATLDKTEVDLEGQPFTFYMTDPETALPTPVPAGLTLDIPGEVFPAFTGTTLPTVSAFALTAPADPSTITPDTTFSWAAADDNAVITLEVYSVDLETSAVTLVECTAQDDGAFSFPAETKAAFGAGFMGELQSAGRQAFRTETKENAVLIIGATSTQTPQNFGDDAF